jgi:hypothetical protein
MSPSEETADCKADERDDRIPQRVMDEATGELSKTMTDWNSGVFHLQKR